MGCYKNSYIMDQKDAKARCPKGKVLDKTLNQCYDPCPLNASGVAGLCVGSCPTGLHVCGAGLCLPKSESCSANIMTKVAGAFNLIFKAATLNIRGAIDASNDLAKDYNYPICENFGGDAEE